MTTVAVHVHPDVSSARGREPDFETVAEEAFRHYARVWKPGALAVNRVYLRKQILPWFGSRPITEVTRTDVQRRFASLHTTPAAADRSLPILSVIFAMLSRAARRCRACRCPSSRACSATPGRG